MHAMDARRACVAADKAGGVRLNEPSNHFKYWYWYSYEYEYLLSMIRGLYSITRQLPCTDCNCLLPGLA